MSNDFSAGYLIGYGFGMLVLLLCLALLVNQDLKRATKTLQRELAYERGQKKDNKESAGPQE